MNNCLQLKDVNKTYENASFQLKNISFSVPYGSIVGFIGENGAGKSTTMGTIIGTLKKDSGTINVFGKDIEEDSLSIKEHIGVVFDEMQFARGLHVTQLSNVMRHIYNTWDEEIFFQYIDRFSLPTKEKIGGFSQGMSMKLSLAVALSHDARLLILDEATAGLDLIARDELLDILYEYVRDEERSILMSTHITSDIEKIADELIFIKKGEIVLHVNKEEMLDHYAILSCDKGQLGELDEQFIVSYVTKGDQMDVLVSNKARISSSFQMKQGTIDAYALLVMKGVHHHERSYS